MRSKGVHPAPSMSAAIYLFTGGWAVDVTIVFSVLENCDELDHLYDC